MKKSYVSWILSGVLASACWADAPQDTIIANFETKNQDQGGKGTWLEVSNGSGVPSENAWYGGDKSLNLYQSPLKFTFGPNGSSDLTKLLFQDGFSFMGNSDQQTEVQIAWNGGSQNASLIFGETRGSYSYVSIRKNVSVKTEGFKNVDVKGTLLIESGGKLDTQGASLQNFTGIMLEGQGEIKTQLFNNMGTLAMGEGSSLTANGIGSNDGTRADTMGEIDVQGNATIALGGGAGRGNTAKITNQVLKIQSQKSLTITNSEASSSLALENVYVQARIPSAETKSSSLVLKGFETLESKGLRVDSSVLEAQGLKTLTNTKMTLSQGYLVLQGEVSLESESNQSEFVLIGEDNLIKTSILNIKGDHRFSGGGRLEILGEKITLGEQSQSTLISGDSKVALGATTLVSKNLKVEGMILQVLNNQTTLQNSALELGNGAKIEAVNQEGALSDLTITKESESGTIKVSNQANASIEAKNIIIQDQNISLESAGDKKTSLSLIAKRGSITLGKTDDSTPFKIEGKNGSVANNVLDLQSSEVNLGKSIEFDKLSIVAGNENGITFYGTQGGSISFKNGTTLSTARGDGNQLSYAEMVFSTHGDANEKSTLDFGGTTQLKASNFIFQNQKILLTNSSNLELYAMGKGEGESGAFGFVNTSFSINPALRAQSAEIALYSRNGAVLLANGLVLDGVDLASYAILESGGEKTYSSLDLSASTGDLRALGSVNIHANGIYASKIEEKTQAKIQGIGMNVYVGDSTKKGDLRIQSDEASDLFFVGGDLVIDNTADVSDLKIELGSNGSVNKLEDQTLGLEIQGGVTAIHKNQASQSTEIKAKNFIFTQRSNLTAINGALKLNTKEDSEIEVKGLVVLEGTETAEAKLEVSKNSNSSLALKLHDIQSTGKASITNQGLSFVDSNIKAVGKGGARSLVLSDTSASPSGLTESQKIANMMDGRIATIALEDADLEFKRGSESAKIAGISLQAGGTITSSGVSKLTTEGIKVGETSSDRFSLNVSSGVFTLIEEKTQNQIGEITLGEGNQGGNFVFLKTDSGGGTQTYNDMILQGNLKSFGNSSLSVNTLISKQPEEKKNYTLSSSNGTLNFNLMGNQDLILKSDIVLQDGGLRFNDSSSQLLSRVALQESTIVAKGDSKIEAGELDLGGASIKASDGILTLRGIKTKTQASDVIVGNAGVLRIQSRTDAGATLSIKDGSTVTLSAIAPYVSPSESLGGGSFGRIEAKSLLFEGKSGEKKLINLSLSGEGSQASTLKDDRLFALREGSMILIETEDGIKKKTGNATYANISLDDVSVDRGSYTSITLSPRLEMKQNALKEEVAQNLLLDVRVSQNTLPEILESIQDPAKREEMKNIFSNPLNQAIAESVLNSNDNVFKVGLKEYISAGNTEVVAVSLQNFLRVFQAATDGIYASDKVAQELKMLRTTSLENRMVRSGNPYVSKLEVAHLLKAVSGVRYASDDDVLLFDEEYSGPNYGSLWANYEGATSFGTLDSAGVNGLSAGYDTLVGDLKEYLLGVFVNYGYGTYSANALKNDSHNFGLGFYSRMTFGQNEVDLVISQSMGINRSDIKQGASQLLSVRYTDQVLRYNFFVTNAQLNYGYLLPVGNEESPFYFKPFGGIDFGVVVNTEAKGDGEAPIEITSATKFKLSVLVGLEMKKYFNENSYIYLLPVLEKGLLNDGGVVNIGFSGSPTIPYAQVHQVDTALGVYAGGQGGVSKNVSITGGLGVKIDLESQDVIMNWNLGFKYKF